MDFSRLFPQPKRIDITGSAFGLEGRAVRVETGQDAPALVQRGASLASRTGDDAPYVVRIDLQPDRFDGGRDAYLLDLNTGGGTLVAATEAAAWHGCHTLCAILDLAGNELPAVQIEDWPDFAWRGLYVESKWGSDRMTLDDWKRAIDHLAELKFNVLGIGVYGCWVVQYGGQRTEFLMVPFPDEPELVTPKTLRYYSPAASDWQVLDYLPTMVTEDLFGEIVAYGKANGVWVRPHFNSPGHNTLFPRVFPEISARDEAGNPIGYGFCLSNPNTWETLFRLYDSVVDRYLLPNGSDWFHMGLDEVEAYKGISEEDPTLAIDPWCRCPDCRDKPHAEQLQDYAIRVALHLKEKGITHITMWNDALDKLNALDDTFAAKVKGAGLADNLVVQYWRYQEPVLVPPADLGLRTWSTPMSGYWPNLFSQSYTTNITRMLAHGSRAGAEGADAYCLYDPGFDRNYVCLAEFGWNQGGEEDLYQFKSRYARALLTPALEPWQAAEAMDQYDQAFGSEAWGETVAASLLYYWHTYPAARETGIYPRDTILELAGSHLRPMNALRRAANSARAAAGWFEQANAVSPSPILDEYIVECRKLGGVADAYVAAVQGVAAYDSGNPAGAADRFGAARDAIRDVMAGLERVKSSFLVPQILRDLSALYLPFDRLASEIGALADGETELPPFLDLASNREDLDRYLASAEAPEPIAGGIR